MTDIKNLSDIELNKEFRRATWGSDAYNEILSEVAKRYNEKRGGIK